MKCDRCNKDASIQLVVMEDGQEKKTIHLCTECAQEAMSSSFQPQDGAEGYQYFQDSLKKLIGVFFDEAKTHIHGAVGDEKNCSFCGAGFSDIMETGRFGCDRCYKEFSDQVRETLRMTQGATKHIGDVPPGYREKKILMDQIEQNKQKLQDMILVEDYEGAAQMRDTVKQLTAQLEGGES